MNFLEITHSTLEDEKNLFIRSFLEIWNHNNNLQYLSYTNIKFKIEQISNWINSISDNCFKKYGYAVINNDIVGIVIINSDKINGFEIMGIGVKDIFKRKGVGTLLLENSIKIAFNSGFKSIDVSVFSDNSQMLRLLLKYNFIPINIENGKRFDGMGIVKLKLMSKI